MTINVLTPLRTRRRMNHPLRPARRVRLRHPLGLGTSSHPSRCMPAIRLWLISKVRMGHPLQQRRRQHSVHYPHRTALIP